MTAVESSHLIACLVENKPGVLYEVSNMFRRRNFNIDSISVGAIEQKDLARMTIAVRGDEWTVEQVIKQLNKLINVVKVTALDLNDSVVREMALVKVHTADANARTEIIQYSNIFRGQIIDVSTDSVTVEITGDTEKIDAFVELARPFGLKEIARTGRTALSRGGKAIRE
ncbi:acetolactate synthase small subunit [Candidatus Bathyarchaeota archaeon]|nr:acetolactate synthase small subunit [Candidatus Bathyarchaeota archaeon]